MKRSSDVEEWRPPPYLGYPTLCAGTGRCRCVVCVCGVCVGVWVCVCCVCVCQCVCVSVPCQCCSANLTRGQVVIIGKEAWS